MLVRASCPAAQTEAKAGTERALGGRHGRGQRPLRSGLMYRLRQARRTARPPAQGSAPSRDLSVSRGVGGTAATTAAMAAATTPQRWKSLTAAEATPINRCRRGGCPLPPRAITIGKWARQAQSMLGSQRSRLMQAAATCSTCHPRCAHVRWFVSAGGLQPRCARTGRRGRRGGGGCCVGGAGGAGEDRIGGHRPPPSLLLRCAADLPRVSAVCACPSRPAGTEPLAAAAPADAPPAGPPHAPGIRRLRIVIASARHASHTFVSSRPGRQGQPPSPRQPASPR